MPRLLAPTVLLALTVPLAAPAIAGEYNPTLSVGDAAPAWEKLPGVDGETLSLGDLKDAQAVVVAFTCNTCPYAVDYEDRLIAFAKKFEGRPVRLVAVNCNAGEKDLLAAMTARAKEKGFPFPYLKDESGAVGKAYGATRTPEFVVLDAERKVVYLGAMDDDPEGEDVRRRYVEEAVQAALEGGVPAVTETPPVGCLVKYPRE
ncbi:MAG TPA: thioredoxin family protein, partial [Planctomycetaceae bacterium]